MVSVATTWLSFDIMHSFDLPQGGSSEEGYLPGFLIWDNGFVPASVIHAQQESSSDGSVSHAPPVSDSILFSW